MAFTGTNRGKSEPLTPEGKIRCEKKLFEKRLTELKTRNPPYDPDGVNQAIRDQLTAQN